MCNQGVKYCMGKHGKGRCVGIVMATSYFLIHYISSLKWFIQVQGKGLCYAQVCFASLGATRK